MPTSVKTLLERVVTHAGTTVEHLAADNAAAARRSINLLTKAVSDLRSRGPGDNPRLNALRDDALDPDGIPGALDNIGDPVQQMEDVAADSEASAEERTTSGFYAHDIRQLREHAAALERGLARLG